MKFEHTVVMNVWGALRGMRNPKMSWAKSDSEQHDGAFVIGKKDLSLARGLVKAGSEHRKFLRQIFVCVDITAPMYWWQEFDTYKIGTTENSTSFMHRAMNKEFTLDDFEIDANYYEHEVNNIILYLNGVRVECLWAQENKQNDEAEFHFRTLRQMLPAGYKYTRTVTMNFENLLNMYTQRKNHRLSEWSKDFVEWAENIELFKMICLGFEK